MSESSGVGSRCCGLAILVPALLVLVPVVVDITAAIAEEVAGSARRVREGVVRVVEEGDVSVMLGVLPIDWPAVWEGSETTVPVRDPGVETLRDNVAVRG